MLMLKVSQIYGNDALPWQGMPLLPQRQNQQGPVYPHALSSFHLLFPMCIPHTIHSLNGSDVPPATSLPTIVIGQRARMAFFLRWIFGKWEDSFEHKCFELQLPVAKSQGIFLIFMLLSALSDTEIWVQLLCDAAFPRDALLAVTFASWHWIFCFQHPPSISGKFLFILQVPGEPVWF